MNLNPRTTTATGLLLIALTASACGGASTETTATQDEIAALQAQIDELENETTDTQAPATTETSAPETVPSTTTTAEPVPSTTEAPEPVNEDTDAAPASAGNGFAVPTGTILEASMGPDDLHQLVLDITGPTQDMAAEIARVAPFPALSTLPDTEIEGVDFWVGPGETQFANTGWNIVAEFTTTATPADAVLAYQAELAAIVGGETTSGVSEQEDYDIHWADVGDYEITALEYRALTTVRIKYLTLDGLPADIENKITGIRSELPLDERALLKDVRLTSSGGSQSINLFYELPDISLDDTQAALDQAVADAGWSASDAKFNITHESPDLAADLSARANSFSDAKSTLSIDYQYLN